MRRDTIVGLTFLAIAAFFAFFGSQLTIGTAARMNAGYVPVLGAVLLGALGAVILGQDLLRRTPEPIARINWRGLICVAAGILVFAFTLRPLGLPLASVLLVLIGCLAERPFRPVQALLLGVFLAAASSLIFVAGIGLQLPLWPTL